MPASLPGATLVENQANPIQGRMVVFDPLSGPKGSLFDAKKPVYAGPPGPFVSDTSNCSTGGLSTGIGIGSPKIVSPISDPVISNALNGIRKSGFDDDQIPGATPEGRSTPPPVTPIAQNTINAAYMYIGGGRSQIVAGLSVPQPYLGGVQLLAAGNGGSRDGGAGPVFTGFGLKMVTAAGTVVNSGVIEAGFVNRSGVTMVIDQSTFGSASVASAAIT